MWRGRVVSLGRQKALELMKLKLTKVLGDNPNAECGMRNENRADSF